MLIAKKPKTAVYTLVVAILAVALAAGCTFTGPKNENGSNMEETLFDRGGLSVAIPNEYIDRLYIPDYHHKDGWGEWLISVFEKQSYEESLADFGEGNQGGFLFGIFRLNRAQYEDYLCHEGSGLSSFAKDDNYYYIHRFATDVQFYRSGIDSYTEEDFAPWKELEGAVGGILDDFVSRNNLTAYSDSEFRDREFTYDSEHVYINYYPYYNHQETATAQGFKWEDVAYKLVLSQPATQGETGIWCVERWYDDDDYGGHIYYYFPACDNPTAPPAIDYYAQLQAECDTGHRADLLEPMQVAVEFVTSYFGDTPTSENLVLPD